MRSKFWKILGIALALLIVLTLLFVVAFIFNPFEGSLRDIRELVPRDADFFVRKTDLKDDFSDFPEPAFWAELSQSPSWRVLRGGPLVADLQRDVRIEQVVADLRRASDELDRASGGFAGLVEDVIGQEVVVAGQFRPPSLQASAYCIYLRVSWKVRFAWGLLEWDSVRQSLAQQGTLIERQADGTMVVGPGSAQPLYIARWLDCLMVSNDEEFLDRSVEYAKGATGEDSFAGTYLYRDGIEAPIRTWEEMTGIRANAVEFYLQPQRLFELTTWDDGWPDPRHPDDINQRVLASFLNLSGWTFLTGSLIFESGIGFDAPDSLTLLGRVELNSNMHTGFQREFFRAEPQDRSEWLSPFLTMVPERACAAAALRMPAGDFLQEMFQAIDTELRRDIDQMVSRTGKYQNVSQLIDSLRPALQPRIGFVFHRKREIGGGIETFDPSPAPHVAWVFWIDPRLRKPLEDLYAFMTQYSSSLGFDKAYDLAIMGGGGGDAAREFVNPNIPGTGEIALLLYGNFFVVSNSGPLIRDMALSRLQGRNVLALRDYETFDQEMDKRLNGFVFVRGEPLAEVVQDYLDFLDSDAAAPDVEWAYGVRAQVEREILRREFPSARAVGSLQGQERKRFDELVDAEIRRRWANERDRYVQADRAAYRQLQALMRTFSSAYLQVTLEPRNMDFKGRVLVQYR